jgi:ribosomal protein L31E
MAKTSLKRIRTFIEMYDKQNEIEIDEYTNEPIPVEGLDKIKYMIRHKREAVYYCETITAAGECVSHIIFNVPMEDNVTLA